jgi:hypothetical protein
VCRRIINGSCDRGFPSGRSWTGCRVPGNHRVSINVDKPVKDGADVFAGQAVLTRSLTKTLRDGVGRTLSPKTLLPMLWVRAMTNWDMERRLACGLVCS